MPNFNVPDEVFLRAARQFPTPFYLYDERGIRQTARDVQAAFAWCPSFKEHFAVKALPNPIILRILQQEGCGFDCASLTELLLVERIGAHGEDIMFSANAMPPEEFDKARAMGALINLDDITDIDTLRDHGGIPDTVCVRYNPGGDFQLSNAIIGKPGESKYGWTRAQLVPGLLKLKSLGMKAFGMHAFLASITMDAAYYPALARLLFQTAQEVQREVGLPLRFINLSGGIGIPYRPEEQPIDILHVGEQVRREYVAAFGAPQDAGIGIRAELGRYMTGPHGWLVTRAMHEKDTHKRFLGVDACAANLLRPAMYGAYHHIHIAGRRDEPATTMYDVTGSLCENNDKFAINRMLPKVNMGDVLVIHDGGAHAYAMGYQYNGRLRSAEILYTQDDNFRLIRRAETPEDYFATMVWPS